MRIVAIIICSIVLAGCHQKTVSEMNYAEIHALADQIRARCAAQGAVEGTQQGADCIKIESQYEINQRNKARADAAEMGAAIAQGMQNAGAAYSAAAANRQTVNVYHY